MRKRRITAWIFAPVILILIIVGIVLSPLGSPIIRLAANSVVPGLKIDNIDGSLLSDFTVENLQWENETWKVTAQQASLNIGLGCLSSLTVCVDKLHTNAIKVTQKQAAPPAPEEPPSNEPVELPVAVSLNDIQINNTEVELPGQHIKLESLSLSANAYERVNVAPLNLNGLTVTLHETAPVEPEPSQPTDFALRYKAPELGEISSPIGVTVEDFSFQNIVIVQGETRQKINQITFKQAQIEQSSVNLDALKVEHESGRLALNSQATLSGSFPLSLSADASFTLGEGVSENVTLEATGALDDLTLAIDARGAYNADLQLTLNALKDALPVQLNARWPQQKVPGVAEFELQQGQLNASGTMGNYQITGSAGATVPTLGTVPVDVDIKLNEKTISVNALNAKLLEGSITNSGTLYLNDTLSWSGTTQVNNMSATSLTPWGPTELEGKFDSLMQLNPKGIEASISDLSLSGIQDEVEFSLSGSAVYSQANELVVSTLRLKQGNNYADIAGQMIKNRYLKGTVKLDFPQLASLYPAVQGEVHADIDVAGEWQDPAANGTISMVDVQVSPQLNPGAAAQGAINGNIELTGALSQHYLETQVTTAQHSMQLALSGGWADERWKGQISQSQLAVFATRWQLQQPFSLAVRPTPFSTKVTGHCWVSRKEGEICLNSLLYKDDVARWNLNANALPLGLWASEAAGDIIASEVDASLNLTSSGKMPKGGEPEGDFTLNITPATWPLGNEGQVPIDIDEVTAKGTLSDGKLIAEAAFQSQQLGNVQANITTSPFEQTPELDGQVTIQGISIAPLKPISPAISELTGEINGQIDIAGQAAAPEIRGELRLTEGNIDIEDTPAKISDWTQTLQFEGTDVGFEGSFALGGGQGSIDGSVNFEDPSAPEITVNLKGDRLEVQQRDIIVRVSPDIQALVKPGDINITGEIAVPWARIKIEELPPSAVAPSKDVHLRGEPPSEDPLSVVDAKIDILIDQAQAGEVKLEAFGLTANLAGELQVASQPAPVGYGSLRIMQGRFEAYGQNLIIQTGEVQFNGPLDQPLLLVEAIRNPDKTADGVVAGIRIDGAADSPNISVFTNPPMNQGNALRYLLTGSAGSSSGDESSPPNYEALLLGLGLSNTNGIQGELGQAIGIDDFSIGTASGEPGSETKLSLSGRLNERLTVQYNVDVGLDGDSTSETVRRRSAPPDLVLRYQWLPQFYIEGIQTTIEEQTEFAVDFYYQFFLGEESPSNKPKPVKAEPENDTEDN
ncbi:translocation/assembly module TamB domain-containing protein [Alteromonas lipotrueiana]|uniref:translocation/assembly module TamB domain-containing protein n=1 Tax=Alteromonas lipotrueiana TaxID=2803815 RepID=UPI001C45848A|nr:translocation/assembly module TamB domain-containing protein [Alteromonas lipotrueiana]